MLLVIVVTSTTPINQSNAHHGDAHDVRLSALISSNAGTHECFLDAQVGLTNSRVADVVLQDSSSDVALGERVLDLPAGLESGNVIPGPVFRDGEGQLRAGYSECVTIETDREPERGASHHTDPNPKSWTNLYGGESGYLSYKAWTVNAEPVPLQDALLILNDVENVWEPMFDFALAYGGYPTFDFDPKDYTETADQKYARMDTIAQVTWFCRNAIVTACAIRWTADEKIVAADLVYGPLIWEDPNDWFQHGLAHEFGHTFWLAHHVPDCGYVMSPDNCPDLAVADDIATALGVLEY